MGHELSPSSFIICSRATEGGEYMNYVDRRQKMIEVLCLRRNDTYGNLACEFNVSRRTIGRDIAVLMCKYPIETSRGYSGGVRVKEGFYLHRRALTQQQVDLLRRVSELLTEEDQIIFNSILTHFFP